MAAPLQGIKVVDLSRALAGPYCTMMLGDLGADVIKIEMPGRGDDTRGWGPPFLNGEAVYYLSVNRNKKSVTLNLRSERGKKILFKLIKGADVLVENFSAGTMAKLGLPYDRVRDVNPRIVYCSISGFGQSGPDCQKPAFDLILQGRGGWMSFTGPVGGPPTKVGIAIADLASGMFAAYAILAALFCRERTGVGQMIDTSLLDGQVALLTFQAGAYFATGRAPTWIGNRHPMLTPYEPFETADGYVNVAVGNDAIWQRFCRALSLEHLIDDERFRRNADRIEHREELEAILSERFRQFTSAEMLGILEAADVPCGPINNLEQVFNDPQVQHLGLHQSVEHPTIGKLDVTGIPYRFSATPGEIRLPPPLLGQHTEEVLTALRYGREDIEALRRDGDI